MRQREAKAVASVETRHSSVAESAPRQRAARATCVHEELREELQQEARVAGRLGVHEEMPQRQQVLRDSLPDRLRAWPAHARTMRAAHQAAAARGPRAREGR